MDRLTLIDGTGRAELVCCIECGSGCGNDNQNCGYCEKMYPAYERLAAYEKTGYTPEDFDNLCREMSSARVAVGASTYEQLRDLLERQRTAQILEKVGGGK